MTVALVYENRFSFEDSKLLLDPEGGGGGWGGTWVNFWSVCAAGLSEPLPHYSVLCGQLLTPF